MMMKEMFVWEQETYRQFKLLKLYPAKSGVFVYNKKQLGGAYCYLIIVLINVLIFHRLTSHEIAHKIQPTL